MTERSISPDVALVVDQIREARVRATALRVVGGGAWLDAGRRCTASHRLDVGRLTGITRYEPGDLTLTARAGTSLADIARATDAEGQWLTLDAHGSPSGTLGGTVATASSGPLASAFGTPRDHVLGCEFVSGTGDVVRAGGRVVKNVAGFDLTRLVTGAWGTLGALTEITVRLRARPEEDRTLAIEVDGAGAAWSWLRQSDYTPLAAELLSPELASRLSLGSARLLVRVGGNAAFTRAASDAVASLGVTTGLDVSTWGALANIDPPHAISLRASTLPSHIGELWPRAVRFVERFDGYAHATIARGVVRCVLPATDDPKALETIGSDMTELAEHATMVGERMPAPLWSRLPNRRSSSALAEGVRRAFDPDGIMNPGILDIA